MTKLRKFRPSSVSRQVMRVRFHWNYIFISNFLYWKARQLASKLWPCYLNKISVKRCISKIAFLELSSWRRCLLRKKSDIDFEFFTFTLRRKVVRAIAIQSFFSVVTLQVYLIYNTAILIHSALHRCSCAAGCQHRFYKTLTTLKVYVRLAKQLSLLYDWHLLNVRQAKYLFSAMFVGRNSNCDVINALFPKAMIFSDVFWQSDQYHYLFQIQSELICPNSD